MFSSGIGQATGLGTTSSVATSAPQNTAEQALSGIAITHGSMDKAFDLKPCDFLVLRISARLSSLAGTTRQAPCSFRKAAPYSPVMVI